MTPPPPLLMLGIKMLVVMQVSVLVPLWVAWRKWGELPAVLRRFCVYFPLSIVSVVASYSLYNYFGLPSFKLPNHWSIVGFNTGKILVLGLTLWQVLNATWARRLTELSIGVALLVILARIPLISTDALTTTARLSQCIGLAVVCMLYVEQLSRSPQGLVTDDPYFWLAIGQLAYSASIVLILGVRQMSHSNEIEFIILMVLTFAGLFQNYTFTLMLLRGARQSAPRPRLR